MFSLFKKNKEVDFNPSDERRNHFFRLFDNDYGFILENGLSSEKTYNSVRNYYAQSQENLYQSMISLVEENDS